MRIAILGTGAIGGVLAGCLSDTNAELVCVSRGRTARDLLEGLTLFTPEGSVEMIPGERFEIIDSCLLYTSPSPRDLSTSRMPSSA